eukprot:CAMPEP_0185703412 /NCGR_PEP_ID=MMETSP1164-20130828/14459_1 /TAXON_ID=1104430 /ORGANISM="Chrysoreinhardia sp, Strain CCMP2950" /LENGTH=49 /DNA_ID= /DNA_START= /DNA_END= /DNA_ORIENTATION=
MTQEGARVRCLFVIRGSRGDRAVGKKPRASPTPRSARRDGRGRRAHRRR